VEYHGCSLDYRQQLYKPSATNKKSISAYEKDYEESFGNEDSRQSGSGFAMEIVDVPNQDLSLDAFTSRLAGGRPEIVDDWTGRDLAYEGNANDTFGSRAVREDYGELERRYYEANRTKGSSRSPKGKPSGGRAEDFLSRRYGNTPEGRKILHERFGYYAEEGWNDAIVPYVENACKFSDAGRLPKVPVRYIADGERTRIDGSNTHFQWREGMRVLANAPEVLVSNAMGDDATAPATILMITPDVPVRHTNTALCGNAGARCLWLVTDVLNNDVEQGFTVCNYQAPKLYTDEHRYIFLVFKGSCSWEFLCEEEHLGNWGKDHRRNFDVQNFMKQNEGLELVSVNYFGTAGPPPPPPPRAGLGERRGGAYMQNTIVVVEVPVPGRAVIPAVGDRRGLLCGG